MGDALTLLKGLKDTVLDGKNFDQFGISVSVSGGIAIVGSFGDDEAGGNSGAAYAFDLGTVLATGTVLRLIEAVIDLDLPQGTENALTAKLDAILLALDGNNVAAAINLLLAFINTAEAQSNHHIPEADAVILIAAALEIIALLSS